MDCKFFRRSDCPFQNIFKKISEANFSDSFFHIYEPLSCQVENPLNIHLLPLFGKIQVVEYRLLIC
jgi:hypothetical protein